MALFSRRPKNDSEESAENAPEHDSEALVPEVSEEETPAPSVGISVSSYRGLGASAAAPAPAEEPAAAAKAPAETVPGLRDNVLLREALARLSDDPTPAELLDLARQVLQGHLFVRVRGDARALLAEGKGLPLAIATVGDRRFALAYSSGGALSASVRQDGNTDTSAVGQPAIAVLRHVVAGDSEGLVIDPASAPARAVLPRPLIERMLTEVDEALTIKTLLAGERAESTAPAVVEALTRVPLWIAVNRTDEDAPFGVAESRQQDGSRFLEVFTHPLEVAALGRGDRAAPLTAERLAAALRADEGLSGILIDPKGPWMRLTRTALAPVLALAE